MNSEQENLYPFKSVEPLSEHRLRVCTTVGEALCFDFTSRLGKTRFADLRNEELFSSAATDGQSIIFQTQGRMPLKISAGEFFELLSETTDSTVWDDERGTR